MHSHGSDSRVIVLAGFMGAGKTTVGKELARLLKWQFVDLDDRIQYQESRTIEEIFRDSGEEEFRRCEHRALRELLCESEFLARVIALGGGAFAQQENATLIREKNAAAVFLDAPVDELFRRCQQQQLKRPLREDETHFRSLYESRQPRYLAAPHRVETSGKAIGQIAEEIATMLGLGEQNISLLPRARKNT